MCDDQISLALLSHLYSVWLSLKSWHRGSGRLCVLSTALFFLFKKKEEFKKCCLSENEKRDWVMNSIRSLPLALSVPFSVYLCECVSLSLPVFPGAVIMISTCGHGSWFSPAPSPGLIITVLLYVLLPQEADWPLWLSVFSLSLSLSGRSVPPHGISFGTLKLWDCRDTCTNCTAIHDNLLFFFCLFFNKDKYTKHFLLEDMWHYFEVLLGRNNKKKNVCNNQMCPDHCPFWPISIK